MHSIVISMGGSVVLSNDIDTSFFYNFTNLLKDLSKTCKVYVVIGGGNTARTYIKLGRKLNFPEEKLDEIGINVTRINAKLIANILKLPDVKIPHTTDEAKEMKENIVVMGGTTPGHSTDMVGAELAEKTNSEKFIIATNVDGVYDKDPNKYDDAKQIKEISISSLIEEYGTDWQAAGKNVVIDGPALEIIARAKLPTFVLNGKKLDEFKKVINNQPFNGTKIKT